MSDFEPAGVYAATPTPMDEDNEINYDTVDDHLEYLAAGGLNGVVPAGCTGHAASLSPDEHVEYVQHVADTAQEYGLDIIPGDGMNVTYQTVELAQRIEDAADIDAHLVISPYQNKPEQEGIVRHYEQVADAVDEPVVVYNVPSRTGKNIEAETTLDLAAHENIVGIKEASGEDDQIAAIADGLQERGINDFALGSGNDFHNHYIFEQAGEAHEPGQTFAVSVTANAAPEHVVSEYDAAATGEYEEAAAISDIRSDLDDAMFLKTNPIPVHEALNQLGFDVGTPREPLAERPATEQQQTINNVLEEYGLSAE